jgi:tetratricopeptide (TPR) repeat protein
LNLHAALLIRVLLGLSLIGLTVGCEKSRLIASRGEFRELTSRSTSDEQRIIALARFVERRPERKTNPHLTQACTAIGRHHARADRPALAAAWYERAVAAVPDDPTLLNLAGYHYAEHGRSLDRAIEMLSRALQLALERDYPPRQIGFFKDSLGWAFRGRGDLRKASTLLGEARELAPDVAIIEKHLAQVHHEIETQEKTGRSLPSSVERSPSTDRGEVDVGGDLETMIEDGDSPDVDTGSQGTGVELP